MSLFNYFLSHGASDIVQCMTLSMSFNPLRATSDLSFDRHAYETGLNIMPIHNTCIFLGFPSLSISL